MTEFSPKKRTYLSSRINHRRRDLVAAGDEFIARSNTLAAQPTLNAEIVVKALNGKLGSAINAPKETPDDGDSAKRTSGSGVKEIEPKVRFDPNGVRDPGQVLKLHVTAADLKSGKDNFGWVDPPKKQSEEEKRKAMQSALQWRASRPKIRLRTYKQDPRTGEPILETRRDVKDRTVLDFQLDEENEVKSLGRTLKDILPGGSSLGGRAARGLGLIVDALGKFRCPPGTPAANQFTDEFGTNCFSPVEVMKDVVRELGQRASQAMHGISYRGEIPFRRDESRLKASLPKRRSATENANKLIGTTLDADVAMAARNSVIADLLADYPDIDPEDIVGNKDFWLLLDQLTDPEKDNFIDLDWSELFTSLSGGYKYDKSKSVEENLSAMRTQSIDEALEIIAGHGHSQLGLERLKQSYAAGDPSVVDSVNTIIDLQESSLRGQLGSVLHELGTNEEGMRRLKKISFRSFNESGDTFEEYWTTDGMTKPFFNETTGEMGVEIEFNPLAQALRPFLDSDWRNAEDENGNPLLTEIITDDSGNPLSATDPEKWEAIAEFLRHEEKMEFMKNTYATDISAGAHGGSMEAAGAHTGYHEIAHALQYSYQIDAIEEFVEKHGFFAVLTENEVPVQLEGPTSSWTNQQWLDAVNATMQDRLPYDIDVGFPPTDIAEFEQGMLHILAGAYYQDAVAKYLEMTHGVLADEGAPEGLAFNQQLSLLMMEGQAELYALKKMGIVSGDEIDSTLAWMDPTAEVVNLGPNEIPEADIPFNPAPLTPDSDMGPAPWEYDLEPGEQVSPGGIIIPSSAAENQRRIDLKKEKLKRLSEEDRIRRAEERANRIKEVAEWERGESGEVKTTSDGSKYVWQEDIGWEVQRERDAKKGPGRKNPIWPKRPGKWYSSNSDGQTITHAAHYPKGRIPPGTKRQDIDGDVWIYDPPETSGLRWDRPEGRIPGPSFRPGRREEERSHWRLDTTEPRRQPLTEGQLGMNQGRQGAEPGLGEPLDNGKWVPMFDDIDVNEVEPSKPTPAPTDSLIPKTVDEWKIIDDLNRESNGAPLNKYPPIRGGGTSSPDTTEPADLAPLEDTDLPELEDGRIDTMAEYKRHRERIQKQATIAMEQAFADGKAKGLSDEEAREQAHERYKEIIRGLFGIDENNPIKTSDPEVAMQILLDGGDMDGESWLFVQLDNVKQYRVLMRNFKREVKKIRRGDSDSKLSGEKDIFDLCKVTVPGTSLFCARHTSRLRSKMPQLSSEDPAPGSKAWQMMQDSGGKKVDVTDNWLAHLREKGIKIFGTRENPLQRRCAELTATQENLDGAKVSGMMLATQELQIKNLAIERGLSVEEAELFANGKKAVEDEAGNVIEKAIPSFKNLSLDEQHNKLTRELGLTDKEAEAFETDAIPITEIPDFLLEPITVTRDGYVVDGHHRWAALVALDILEDDEIFDQMMNVVVIDLDINDAMGSAVAFSDSMGMYRKDASDNAQKRVFPPGHPRAGEEITEADEADNPLDSVLESTMSEIVKRYEPTPELDGDVWSNPPDEPEVLDSKPTINAPAAKNPSKEINKIEKEIEDDSARLTALANQITQLTNDEDSFVITREEFDNRIAEIKDEQDLIKARKGRNQQSQAILKRQRENKNQVGMRSIQTQRTSPNSEVSKRMTTRNAELADAAPSSSFSAPDGWGSNYKPTQSSRALPPIQSRSSATSKHYEKLDTSLNDLIGHDSEVLGPNGSILDVDPKVAEFISNNEKEDIGETIANAAVQYHRGFDRRPRVLLDSEEFENLLGTGGHTRPDIPYGENSAADLRMDYDLRNGFDIDTPANQRPVSGHLYHATDDDKIDEILGLIEGPRMRRLPDYWDSEGEASWGNPLEMGGDIELVLRPEISDRTHYGTGDAMSRGAIPTPMNSNSSDEILAAHTPRWDNGQEDGPFNNTKKMHDLLRSGVTGNYRDVSPDGEHHEAQISGGVNLDDVEFVRYPISKLNWNSQQLDDDDIGKNDKSVAAKLRDAGFSNEEINFFYGAISDGRVSGLRNVNWLRQHLAAQKEQERFNRLGVGVKFTNPDGIDLMNADSFTQGLTKINITGETPREVLGKRIRLEITMRADELLKDVRNQMPKNSAGVLV